MFPVFHNSLLRPKPETKGLPGQDKINKAESKNIRGRVLEREDGTEEVVEKWEFESLLDCHDEAGLHYLVKWRHQAPTWQPADDLKGQDKVILEFHNKYPSKPGPPSWVRRRKQPTPQPQAASVVPPRRSPRLRRLVHGFRRVTFANPQHIRLF